MGYTRWKADDWTTYSSTTSTKTADRIFTSKKLHSDLNPSGVLMRESRDSDLNPNSNAIIIGVDVTGSMGIISEYMVKTGLGVLFNEILDRKPVADPHLMVMAIGDVKYDSSPLQVSQFEADITITDWLEKIHVEQGGGGNDSESYHLPLYFAAHHTSIDCFEKRNKKGYLFTIGDEFTPPQLSSDDIYNVMGYKSETNYTYEELLDAASKMYEVFHIIVAEGSCARRNPDKVKSDWVTVLGQRAVVLTDYTKLSEVIVSLIEVTEGKSVDDVVASWSGDTSLVVKTATTNLTKSMSSATDVVVFD